MIRDLGDANPYAAQANLFPQVNKIYTNTCLFQYPAVMWGDGVSSSFGLIIVCG